jgi:hypothetical protein
MLYTNKNRKHILHIVYEYITFLLIWHYRGSGGDCPFVSLTSSPLWIGTKLYLHGEKYACFTCLDGFILTDAIPCSDRNAMTAEKWNEAA